MVKNIGIQTNPFGGSAPYTYVWTPATGLSATNVPNPTANPASTTTYRVTITDANSNSITDSVTVFVGNFPPKIQVVPQNDTLCGPDTLSITIENDQSCALNGSECLTNPGKSILGTSTFQTSAVTISPFHVSQFAFNPVRSTKRQFIMQPAELRALGMVGKSNISSIGFFTNAFAVWTYDNFTIRMGCIPDSNFITTSFKTGLQTVFDPKTVVIPIGQAWTEHQFDNSFTWDGISSIVVEVCFSNGFDQGFNGPIVQFSNFTGQGLMIHNAGLNSVCGVSNGVFVTNTRPNVRVGYCRVTHKTPLTYSWNPAATLSAGNTYNPLATVATSTDYILTATDTNGCVLTDTASIVVASDFNLSVPNDTSVCNTGPFPLTVTDNAGAGAKYSWSPSSIIPSPNAANATANISATTDFIVDVTSSGGCLKSDTFNVFLVPSINLNIETVDSTICLGDSIKFDVTTDQPSCVAVNQSCSNPSPIKVGTGTNNLQGAAISPFGTGGINHNSQKKQIIIRKSELNALGIVDPSLISSLGVSINSLSGQTSYENFTIKMGCTMNTEFNFATNTDFESPLQTVFNAKTVAITTGFNNFQFDQSFVWDGVDNLLIELCYENATPLSLINDFQNLPASNPGFAAILFKSGTSVCGDLTGGFVSFFRPDLTFGVCDAPPRNDLTYQWTPSAGLLDDTMSETTGSPASTTLYTLTAQAPNSVCLEKDSILVTVAANYTTSTSNDTILCEPGPVPVNVSHTAASAVTFNWEPAALFNNPAAANTIANVNSTSELIVRLNSGGCVKFDTVLASVLDLVDKNVSSASPSVCQDSSIQLDAQINLACATTTSNTCTSPLLAQPAGGTSASSNIVGITPFISSDLSSKRQYLFRASELIAAGMTPGATISDISLNINSLGVTNTYENFTIQMGCVTRNQFGNRFLNGLVTVFNSKTITVATGNNTFILDQQYNWDGISNLVFEICYLNSGFVSPFWQGSNVDYITTGYRSAIVMNGSLSVCSAVNGGQVFWRPKFEFGYCPNTTNYNYSWSPAASLNSSAISNPIASPDSTTNYVITFTETNSACQYQDSILIKVSDFLVDAINDTVVCNSFGLELNVNTDASAPFTYDWSPSVDISDTSIKNPVLTTEFGGYFAIAVTDSAGCAISDTVYVNLFPEPVITVTRDTIICSSNNLTLNASGGVSYTWSPTTAMDNPFSSSPLINGLKKSTIYQVEIIDGNLCPWYDTVEVEIYPTPTINLGKDSTYCSDFSTKLSAGSGFLSYEWNTGDTGTSITATPPGTYAVEAIDEYGCLERDTVKYGVLPAPITSFKDEYLLCENDSLILDASNSGSTYNWSTGSSEREVTIKSEGEFWVEVNNGLCIGTDTFSVEKLLIPVSELPDTVGYCENDYPFGVPVNAGPPEYSYLWSNGKRVEGVELKEPGAYTVLIQNGLVNCSVLDTVVIEQFCIPVFYIPNSFTPNDDQINDNYSIVARNIYKFNFKVFNQWGELVYETDNPNFSWDGTYDGNILPNDAYVWKITYDIRKSDGSFEAKSKEGLLHLMR